MWVLEAVMGLVMTHLSSRHHFLFVTVGNIQPSTALNLPPPLYTIYSHALTLRFLHLPVLEMLRTLDSCGSRLISGSER